MSNIVENIKEELIKRCNTYNEKYNYDFWNDHIKYVVKNAVELAKKYEADVEIVELGALLHDIAMPSEFGPREEHNVYGMKIGDADVMAHFDCIPSLFHLVFSKNEMGLSIQDGTEFVKKKLERDYNKLSPRTREILKERYENIINILFRK